MLAFAFYLLKVIICSGILFGYYLLVLRNKIFHRYNRFYLLATMVLSLALPLIQINIWHDQEQTATAFKLLQAVNSSDEYLDEIIITARKNNFTAEQALFIFYVATSFVFLCLFIQALARIARLFSKHPRSFVENIFVINTTAKGTPFSFLKYIFWNEHIDPETPTGSQVFRHELAHVQQKHSYDKLFMNIVLIFCWCNPFFWLIRKELNMIHEFMADKIAVEDSDTQAFAAMILQTVYPQHRFQLTNPFFYSPIKRRLMMLTKNRHSKVGYIGRLLVLPLAVFIFAAFTLKAKTLTTPHAKYDGKKITVVIDAGHGGTDNGALASSGNVMEKDLTLAIIQKIKALNTNNKIDLVFTREADSYQSPQEKVDFANNNKAALFISVHMDADNMGNASGMSVLVAKDSHQNAAGSKLFASALIHAFSGYALPVQPQPQQRQMGIKVLQSVNCPSVLIEAGNISNTNDLAYLQSAKGIETIATNILRAVENYAVVANDPTVIKLSVADNNGVSTVYMRDTVPQFKLKNTEKVLYVVDGKIVTDETFQKLKGEDIESIDILKGEERTKVYGEKGKNGVILVKTKNGGTQPLKLSEKIEEVRVGETTTRDNVIIRGEGMVGKQPLYVVDGNILPANKNIDNISPDNIQSITVLKDASAKTLYGEAGNNGVILVTTKTGKLKEVTIEGNSLKEVVVVGYGEKSKGDLSGEPIFTEVENNPAFPGGDTAWQRYLMRNINGAMPIDEGWKPGVYKIIVSFIVRKDGTVADVKTTNYAGSRTAEQCIDLIRNGPKWKPAIQNGKAVNAYKKQPITFVVEENGKL